MGDMCAMSDVHVATLRFKKRGQKVEYFFLRKFPSVVDSSQKLKSSLLNSLNNNNNNNNTSICKAHNVSIRAESEAPAVARWRGWLEG